MLSPGPGWQDYCLLMVHQNSMISIASEFCNSSLNHGVLCTASRDGKRGMLCWCPEEQDPLP
eukprot:scaffold7624_cov17-Tisochrysis_lutea.AAC.2